MTEPRIVDLPDALRRREYPTVGSWNRLEARPRTTAFDRALRAEVRDPLWMLTRQWQLGEFTGNDGGSPVTATYSVTSVAPNRFRAADGPPGDLPANRPLETVAERRRVPFGSGSDPGAFDLRLALGRRWLRLIGRSNVLRGLDLPEQYVERYPIALPDPTADADTSRVAHPEVWAGLQAVAGRRLDGFGLYQHIKGGGHAYDGINRLQQRHRTELDALGTRLLGWFDDLIDQPAGAASWDPRRLEHRFAISAGPSVLTAPEYSGGELDWHAFTAGGAPLGGAAPVTTTLNRTVFPAPVRFSGMPLPRWWAVEDGRTNFAAVTPDSTDLARLVFLEFALVYSNDWYQLPCDVPAGTLTTVQGLAVTDVFGQRRWITPAGSGGQHSWQQWSMFSLGGPPGLLVPPGGPKVTTGPVLEDVSLMRDENANLVWGVEQTVLLATGDPRRGDEAAGETLAHRTRLHPAPPPDDFRAPIAYEIQTPVPENWIPFVPVHVPGDNRSVQLRRATLPSAVDATPVRPRTALLGEQPPYFINEEEVPRTGTRLTLAYNRTRWRDGRVVVWLSARRGLGRGEGSSGLAFDLPTPTSP